MGMGEGGARRPIFVWVRSYINKQWNINLSQRYVYVPKSTAHLCTRHAPTMKSYREVDVKAMTRRHASHFTWALSYGRVREKN